MKVQTQTKHQLRLTKQEIISILQDHIKQQGILDTDCEVISDNLPDQIIIEMIGELEVKIDTETPEYRNSQKYISEGIGFDTNSSSDNGSKLTETLLSNNNEKLLKPNLMQNKALTVIQPTPNVSAIPTEHLSTSPLGPKKYPKDWDPFAD